VHMWNWMARRIFMQEAFQLFDSVRSYVMGPAPVLARLIDELEWVEIIDEFVRVRIANCPSGCVPRPCWLISARTARPSTEWRSSTRNGMWKSCLEAASQQTISMMTLCPGNACGEHPADF